MSPSSTQRALRARPHATVVIPPSGAALAMPRGPVNHFAQAADFYDSIGICHHPEYLYYVPGGPWDNVAVARMQELGLRHVRLGMYSAANYGADQFYTGSGRFGLALKNANAARASGVQPISALWGTTEEPQYEAIRNSSVYTVTTGNGTFLRPLDGPTGTYPSPQFGASNVPFATYPIKDNFSRGDGPIGGSWSNDPFAEGTPAAALVGNQWQAGVGGQSTMHWNANPYSGGHIEAHSGLKAKATTAGAWLRAGIMQTPFGASISGYLLQIATDTDTWTLYRYDNGTPTVIAGPTVHAIAVPDRYGIEVKNGVVSGYRCNSGYYGAIVTANDSTYQFPGSTGRILFGTKDSGRAMRIRDVGGGDSAMLQNFGIYYNQGWVTAGGLQGPNEPNNGRIYGTFWGSIRGLLHDFKDAVAARTTQPVLGGADYIDSSTGRIASGPAYAPQLPVVGFHLTADLWALAGDYKDGTDIDVACRHLYWGGHGCLYSEQTGGGMWGGMAGNYTGLPRMVTEMGYYQRTGYDGGVASDGLHPGWNRSNPASPDGQRHCPQEVAGEYILRTCIQHYAELNVRRTYIYKLCDEEPNQVIPPWVFGLCDTGFVRRSSFYAVKNLLALVGWTQGPTSTPLTLTSSFAAGGSHDFDTGSWSGPKNIEDHFGWVCLQRTANEFLVLMYRQRDIWSRGYQTYQTVADPQNVTFTVAGHTVTSAACAQPSMVSVQAAANGQTLPDPDDGQSYPNPGDGQAYSTIARSGNTFTVPHVAGLVRVVKFTI